MGINGAYINNAYINDSYINGAHFAPGRLKRMKKSDSLVENAYSNLFSGGGGTFELFFQFLDLFEVVE